MKGSHDHYAATPLAGKTSFVTGPSRQIGAAFARRLSHEGAAVAIFDEPSTAAAAVTADEITRNGVSLHSAGKASLEGWMKGLARDVGLCKITANVVHPSPTNTDINPVDDPDAEIAHIHACGMHMH